MKIKDELGKCFCAIMENCTYLCHEGEDYTAFLLEIMPRDKSGAMDGNNLWVNVFRMLACDELCVCFNDEELIWVVFGHVARIAVQSKLATLVDNIKL